MCYSRCKNTIKQVRTFVLYRYHMGVDGHAELLLVVNRSNDGILTAF